MCAKSLALSAVFAMATTQNFVAKRAWQSMIIHNRTEFMAYLDETTHDACQYWGRYNYMNEHDNGPSELYNPEWYLKNVAWGPWLCEANRWAKIRDEKVHERLVAFHRDVAVQLPGGAWRTRRRAEGFCASVKRQQARRPAGDSRSSVAMPAWSVPGTQTVLAPLMRW